MAHYPIDAENLLPRNWVIVDKDSFMFLAENFRGNPHQKPPEVQSQDYQLFKGILNGRGEIPLKVPVDSRMIHLVKEGRGLKYRRRRGLDELYLNSLGQGVTVAVKTKEMDGYEITREALCSENTLVCDVVKGLADYGRIGKPAEERPLETDDQMCFKSLYL